MPDRSLECRFAELEDRENFFGRRAITQLMKILGVNEIVLSLDEAEKILLKKI